MSYPTQQQQQYGNEKPLDQGPPGQAAGYYGGAPNVPETYNAPQNYNQGPYGGAGGGGGDMDRSYQQGPPQGQYPPGQYMNQGPPMQQQPTVIYQQAPEKDNTSKYLGLGALLGCCLCCCGPDEVDCC